MLPFKNRLTSRKDFESVYRQGHFFSFGKIKLKIKKNDTAVTRVGLSVGINFSKKATERNKLKRQLREIMRGNLKEMKKGWDLILTVKKTGALPFSFKDLRQDLKETLKRSNLTIKVK